MAVRGTRWRLGAGAAVAGLLVGCGGSDPGWENTSGDGPLAEFFGWESTVGGVRPELTEPERQRQREVEERVADCMSEAGFEYVPRPAADRHQHDPFEDIWALQADDPAEFARQYGYGYSTLPLTDPSSPPEPETDPNQAIRDGLPAAEQEVYDTALWGDLVDEEPGEVPDGTAGEARGCYPAAQRAVYDLGAGDGDYRFDRLHTEWGALYQQIDADPRLERATEDWAGCMAESGLPGFTEVYQPQDAVTARMSEVYGWNQPDPDTVGDAGSAGGLPSPEDPDAPDAPAGTDPAGAVDDAALADLRDYERELATADHECRQAHYEPVYRTVRDEWEERFIAEHRADLEAYRDWLSRT